MQADQLFAPSEAHYQIAFETINLQQISYFNFLQASDINQKSLPNLELSEHKDFSSKNILSLHIQSKISQEAIPMQYHSASFAEDPLYNVLRLSRGKSQDMDIYESRFTLNRSNILDQSQVELYRQLDFEMQLSQKKTSQLHVSEGETSTKKEVQSVQPPIKSSSTKNMTKNMGKLLLKWIWNNRQVLRLRLQQQESVWQHFLCRIKEWKKFLTSKWHGKEPECRIFRMISAHFYRRQCLAAIAESNIEDKWIHLKKRNKFLAGTIHPNALDTLN